MLFIYSVLLTVVERLVPGCVGRRGDCVASEGLSEALAHEARGMSFPSAAASTTRILQVVCTRSSLYKRHADNFTTLRTTHMPKFHLARHVSTRHDSKRSTCRVHALWLCRAFRTARLDTLDTLSSTGSTRSTRRARQARLAT